MGIGVLVGCLLWFLNTLCVCMSTYEVGSSAKSENHVSVISTWLTYALKGLESSVWVDWQTSIRTGGVMNILRSPSATATSNFRICGMAAQVIPVGVISSDFLFVLAYNAAIQLLLLHRISYQNPYLCSLALLFFQFGIFLPSILYWQSDQADLFMCPYLRKAVLKLVAPFLYFYKAPLYLADFILTSVKS